MTDKSEPRAVVIKTARLRLDDDHGVDVTIDLDCADLEIMRGSMRIAIPLDAVEALIEAIREVTG